MCDEVAIADLLGPESEPIIWRRVQDGEQRRHAYSKLGHLWSPVYERMYLAGDTDITTDDPHWGWAAHLYERFMGFACTRCLVGDGDAHAGEPCPITPARPVFGQGTLAGYDPIAAAEEVVG